jgi:hypothetical protein
MTLLVWFGFETLKFAKQASKQQLREVRTEPSTPSYHGSRTQDFVLFSLDIGMDASPLSFEHGPPRVLLTSDTEQFDSTTMHNFRAEGYQVSYLHYGEDRKAFSHKILHVADGMEMGDRFAIVGATPLCLAS